MNVTISTVNVLKESNNGYNEIHKINSLISFDHVIATVDSIIKNNIEFSRDTILESVFITFGSANENVANRVRSYYDNTIYKSKVSICVKGPFFTTKYLK